MKNKKSKELFAILILNKDEHRDELISNILDVSYKLTPKIGDIFITYLYANGDYTFSEKLSYVKSWKTIRGVENNFAKLIPKQNHIFRIVDISDIWNDDIDIRIEKEKKIFEKRILNLEKSKIQKL